MKKLILLFSAVFCATAVCAAPPRLVVQIVVSSMRAEDLARYSKNFTDEGFNAFFHRGTRFTDARYDYQQTTTPVSLATLGTGAMPSTHGVIGTEWMDYTQNRKVNLTEGRKGHGAYQLIVPTLGDALLQHSPQSKCVSIAAEAPSAIIMAGHTRDVFWLDPATCGWTNSEYYASELPQWIARANKEKYNLSYISSTWQSLLDEDEYINAQRHWELTFSNLRHRNREKEEETDENWRIKYRDDYDRMRYTPAGNSAVFGFAKQVIAQYQLGADTTPDLLNICLDSSQRIAELYGPESAEMEDAYYRLDRELGDFLTFLFAQVKNEEVVVVLTSDHGTSPSYDLEGSVADRFNNRQFLVIVNGFLNVRYGKGDWVTAISDNSVWLNHNLIYERGLDLAQVQNEVAIFAMQFRGVSHALAATAMRSSYFGSGYARKMQNSFYPRRSGDVIINLMPGWIEERERCYSSSGSMYGYDTEVPLLFLGSGIIQQKVGRCVDMTSVAPTLARLLEISDPAAAEGEALPEITE